jgi:hypothetical protein
LVITRSFIAHLASLSQEVDASAAPAASIVPVIDTSAAPAASVMRETGSCLLGANGAADVNTYTDVNQT